MRYFDTKTSLLIVFLCLPLLFFPKINLLSFGGRETAGIRIDDIFLLSLAVVVFWSHFALQKTFWEPEKWLVLLIGFSLLSWLSNRFLVSVEALHVHAVIFYAIRLFEYFIFFYVGIFASRFVQAHKIILAFFAWNVIWMLLQKANFIGQFGTFGYVPYGSDRVSGIASFPSEAGLFLNLIFCMLLYQPFDWKKLKKFHPLLGWIAEKSYLYWLFLLFALLIIWTGSRIAILALGFCFFFRIKKEINWRSSASLVCIAIFLGLATWIMSLLIMNTNSIFYRSAGLLSFSNLELFGKVWERISLDYDPIGNEAVKFEAYDMSWWMRIHKWTYALKIYLLHPECYLQGIGPGFAMAGLDGGFLRILVENGLVGSYLYWRFFSSIYHKSIQLKWMLIAFFINMIFFDAYLAYKPMSLIFFVAGHTYACSLESLQKFNKLLKNHQKLTV